MRRIGLAFVVVGGLLGGCATAQPTTPAQTPEARDVRGASGPAGAEIPEWVDDLLDPGTRTATIRMLWQQYEDLRSQQATNELDVFIRDAVGR
jgi:hypothetical protein